MLHTHMVLDAMGVMIPTEADILLKMSHNNIVELIEYRTEGAFELIVTVWPRASWNPHIYVKKDEYDLKFGPCDPNIKRISDLGSFTGARTLYLT